MNMFKFMELIRWLTGPAERRAFRRAGTWGLAAFALDFSFCVFCGGGWIMGVGYGAIIGWFGFTAGLITGLADAGRVSG